MFSVERFGFTPHMSGENVDDDQRSKGGNKTQMTALLQKSKERQKQKDLELEDVKKANIIAEKAAAVKKKAKAEAVAAAEAVSTKRKHVPRQPETDEDRKKRKADAKQAKKDRKAKIRLDGESETTVNNEKSDADVNKSKLLSTDEQDEQEEMEEEDGSTPVVQTEGFASLLQQLDPNRLKNNEVKISTLTLKASPPQQQRQEGQGQGPQPPGDDVVDDTAMDIQTDPSEAVDLSNQYNLNLGENTTPEIFVPVTVKDSVSVWGVDSQLAETLVEDGISSFFPVQAAVLPLLLQSAKRPFLQPRDICVSAPTGSGKTLSYALPIIQTLRSRVVIRLRALILLPSRELASQVYRVFCHLASHTDLMVALATGQTNLDTEREMFIDSNMSQSSLVDILICTPGRLLDHIQGTPGFTLEHCQYLVLDEADRLLGNAYDHWVRTLITNTGVVNSAQSSRNLAMRSFQFQRSSSDYVTATASAGGKTETETKSSRLTDEGEDSGMVLSVLQRIEDMKAQRTGSDIDNNFPTRKRFLQRLLFSATLTDNPRKLSLLGIRNPLIIRTSLLPADILSKSKNNLSAAEEKVSADEDKDDDHKNIATITTSDNTLQSTGYLLPSTLTETVLICEAASRPLTVIALIHEAIVQLPIQPTSEKKTEETIRSMHVGLCNSNSNGKETNSSDEPGTILIFASSVESAHRLCRLLQLYNGQLTSVLKELRDEDDDEGEDSEDTSTSNSDSDSDSDSEKAFGTSNRNGLDLSTLQFGGEVKEMTRIVNSEDRSVTMDQARMGQVRIIVSSDQLARGIDLASVKLVINYDPPKHPRTYVHRVGRTARANREGQSITMLKLGHLGEFKKLRKSIDSRYDEVGKSKVSKLAVKSVEANYQYAIKHLSVIIDAESSGSLRPGSH